MAISREQYEALLRAPDEKAIFSLQRSGKSFAYMAQHAVRTELIRVFGFGGWSGEVLETQLISQREVPRQGGQGSNWEVLWRVRYRLTVFLQGAYRACAIYTEDAIGSATGPHLADVHDQALKSAESDAMKRCAVNLGSRFGLSLYFNGYTGEVVRHTIDAERVLLTEGDGPTPEAGPDEAIQEAVTAVLNLSGPPRPSDLSASQWFNDEQVERAREEIDAREGDIS